MAVTSNAMLVTIHWRSLWRNQGSRARRLVSDLGGVRQARQIELIKCHMRFRLRFSPSAGGRCADRASVPSSRLDTFSGLRRQKRCH